MFNHAIAPSQDHAHDEPVAPGTRHNHRHWHGSSGILIHTSRMPITGIPIERRDRRRPRDPPFLRSTLGSRDQARRHAVWLAARDPRTPRYAKWLALAVAAYALFPIDLIPDFIPVIGYDIVIVPLGVLLVLRLIPPELMQEHPKPQRQR